MRQPASAAGADHEGIRKRIDVCDTALAAMPLWSADRWMILNQRGMLRRALHAATLEPEDLAAALVDLEAAWDAADLAPEGCVAGHNLGNTLLQQYEYTLDDTVLSWATSVLVEAEESAASSRHPRHDEVINSLASARERNWTAHYDLEQLRAAIQLQRRAVDLTASAAPDMLPQRLTNLSDYLWSFYSFAGRPEEAVEALGIARRALALAPEGHPQRRYCLVTLVDRCLAVRGVLGDVRDLTEEAIRLATEVVAIPATTVLEEENAHQVMASAYRARFQLTQAPSDLDRALAHQQRVVDLTPPNSMNRATSLANLARLHATHASTTGDSGVRHTAERLFGEAAEQAAGVRDALVFGAQRDTMSVEGFSPTDVATAERLARAALESAEALDPQDTQRLVQLLNAAVTLTGIYRRSPDTEQARAVQAERILRLLPHEGFLGAQVRAARAELLSARAFRSLDPEDLDQAIAEQRAAIGAMRAARDPLADLQLVLLANLLEVRALPQGGSGDPGRTGRDLLTEVIQLREMVSRRPASSIDRFAAFQSLARSNAKLGRWTQAADAYRAALGGMAALAPAHLNHADRESLLAQLGSLPADAAAVLLQIGDPSTALELAEAGRGLLISESVGLRDRFPEVEAADQGLARRLSAVRASLTLWRDPGADPQAKSPSTDGSALLKYRALSAELEQVLHEIREQPSLRRFLLPDRAEELLAQPGPVAVVFCSAHGSAALVAYRGVLTTVSLPHLTPGRVAVEIEEFDRNLQITGAPETTLAERDSAEESLTRLLAFLWNVLAQPVLDDPQVARWLGDPELERAADGRPRFWWCPVGSLGRFPLHAAGTPPHVRATRTAARLAVMDRVVSSYASSLTTLQSARATGPLAAKRGILSIGIPDTPGRPPLTLADDEIASVAAWAPGADQLQGARATRSEVLTRLRTADWLHFVGHAEQGPGTAGPDSGSGVLVTHDHLSAGAIGVEDLLRGGAVRRHWLAYLSACSTARGRPELVDQSLHVAGALQAAGFAHVIATHWAVRSDTAALVAQDFYEELPQRGPVRHQDVALALDEAVRFARDYRPDRPSRWAPVHHRGP